MPSQDTQIHSQLGNAELAVFLNSLTQLSRPIIRDWFRSGRTIEWKADESPVTMADKAVERALRDAIEAAFPDDAILGEEHADTDGTGSGYSWVIDPIDGTRAFICGRPVFGTLVGLVKDDQPVAGFIDMPMLDECFVSVGGTTTLNGTAVRTSGITNIANARVATTSPEALSEPSCQAFYRLSRASATSTYGGDCHNYALLAAGHIDVVFEEGLKSHDIMGVVEVMRAAGATVTGSDGSPVSLQTSSSLLAAATPELHTAALAIIKG